MFKYSINCKLLTEDHLEFLSLKGGCTGLFESIPVKMAHRWKSHVRAQICHCHGSFEYLQHMFLLFFKLKIVTIFFYSYVLTYL